MQKNKCLRENCTEEAGKMKEWN